MIVISSVCHRSQGWVQPIWSCCFSQPHLELIRVDDFGFGYRKLLMPTIFFILKALSGEEPLPGSSQFCPVWPASFSLELHVLPQWSLVLSLSHIFAFLF